MIRQALQTDMDRIVDITEKVKVIMLESGNEQWSRNYPLYEDFYNDITEGNLFVESDVSNDIKAFICLNTYQPSEYADVPWKEEKRALVIHRMAVDPDSQGRGLAKKLLLFSEMKAKEMNFDYLRTDTCTANRAMNSLFIKLDFRPAGEIRFPRHNQQFICYEKLI